MISKLYFLCSLLTVYGEADGMFLSQSAVFNANVDAAVMCLYVSDIQCISAGVEATSKVAVSEMSSRG